MQGFALIKGLQAVLALPLLAYFIPSRWQLAFGLIPTYWAAKVYWLLAAGAAGAYALVGLAYQLALLILLQRRFNTITHR